MPKLRPNLGRIAIQDQILAKFGEAKIQEFHERLCQVCIFRELHGRPCRLFPITLEGNDCGYFVGGDISPQGGT
jgi:hypothetical protein